jgi:hypothetical protein
MIRVYRCTSTKASLSSVKILGYMTSAKIGDGSWHGTAENFMLNWQEQIRLYERCGHFSDEQKLIMLHTAVHPLQELCQVRAMAALLKVHTQKDLDYDAYSSLLLSTASDYDSRHSVRKVKGKYMHMSLTMVMKTCMMFHMRWIHSILIPLLTPYKLLPLRSHLVQV